MHLIFNDGGHSQQWQSSSRVRSLAFGPDGAIFVAAIVGNGGQRLHIIDPLSTSRSSSSYNQLYEPRPFIFISQLFSRMSNSHKLYFANNGNLTLINLYAVRSNERNSTFQSTNLNISFANRIFVDHAGTIYTLTPNLGISVSTNGGNSFTNYLGENLELWGRYLNDVYVDHRERIYVISRNILYISTNRGQNFTQHSLGVFGLNRVYVDLDGTIYIGIDNRDSDILMTSKDDGNTWTGCGVAKGLSGRYVDAIAQHPNGSIYVGTNDGIKVMRWTTPQVVSH